MKKRCIGLFNALALLSSPAAFGAQNDAFWGSAKSQLKGNLKAAERVAVVPKTIADQFPGKELRVFSIDLDSDAKGDYIVTVHGEFQTCYFDSSFARKHCETRGIGDGFSYYYFAQLDGDRMLELFDLTGDEDSSDYKLLKFDPKTWAPKAILQVYPILQALDAAHNGLYWGYPWDISDLPLKKKGASVLVRATWADNPDRDFFDQEKAGPKFLFEGIPTQGDATGLFNPIEKKFKWLTLAQIRKAKPKTKK